MGVTFYVIVYGRYMCMCWFVYCVCWFVYCVFYCVCLALDTCMSNANVCVLYVFR